MLWNVDERNRSILIHFFAKKGDLFLRNQLFKSVPLTLTRGFASERVIISGGDVARKLNLSPSGVSKSAVSGRWASLAKRIKNDIFDFK